MPAQGIPKNGWEKFLPAAAEAAQRKWGTTRNDRIQGVRDARKHLTPPKLPPKILKLLGTMDPAVDSGVEDLLRHTQGLYAQEMPHAEREVIDRTDRDEIATAERIENWLNAAHEKMLGYAGNNVYAKITDAFGQDGQCIWTAGVKLHRYHFRQGKNEEPEAYIERIAATRARNFPFYAEFLDTTTWYPIGVGWDEDGMTECMVITDREQGPLYEQFGEDLGPSVDTTIGGGSGTSMVRFIEYMNRTHLVYFDWSRNKVLKEVEHHLERVAYWTPEFSTTAMRDPRYQTEGIADGLVAVQKKIETVLNMLMVWGTYTATPAFQARPVGEDAGSVDPRAGRIDVSPLDIVTGLPEGTMLEAIAWPEFGATALKWLDILFAEKDRLSLAPILLGVTTSQQSGPVNSQMMEAARGLLTVSEGNFAGAFNDFDGFLLFAVEKIVKQPVTIGNYTIEPKDIKGNYKVTNRVRGITRVIQAIEQQMAQMQYQAGIITKLTLAKKSGIPNPAAELRGRRAEDFQESNIAKQKIWTTALDLLAEAMGLPPATAEAPGMGTPPAGPGGMSGPGPQQLNQGPTPGMEPMVPAGVPPNGVQGGG